MSTAAHSPSLLSYRSQESPLDGSRSPPALTVLLRARGNTINHRLLETGADGGRGGGEAARLYLAKLKAHSAKENVSGFSFEEC